MISISGPNKDEYDREIEGMLADFGAKVKAILQPVQPEAAKDARELASYPSPFEFASACVQICKSQTLRNDKIWEPVDQIAQMADRYVQARLASAREQGDTIPANSGYMTAKVLECNMAESCGLLKSVERKVEEMRAALEKARYLIRDRVYPSTREIEVRELIDAALATPAEGMTQEGERC